MVRRWAFGPALLVVAVLVIVLAGLALAIPWLWWVWRDYPKELVAAAGGVTDVAKSIELENTARGTVTQALGMAFQSLVAVGVGGVIGIYFALRNAQAVARNSEAAVQNALVASERLISERFAQDIEHLASDKLEVRLGGVYALERLAKDSRERNYWTITDLLCAYVREHAPWPALDQRGQAPGGDAEATAPAQPATDVQAALTVLGRRQRMDGEPPLDLRITDLRGADLVRADLMRALLFGANLEGAYVWGGAHLEEAQMEGARLDGAKLIDVFLRGADLRGVSFRGADLTGAHLDGTDLGAATGLTAEQIEVIGQWDEGTTLPPGLRLPERVKTTVGG
jgi:hypothetical protein